MRVLLIDDSKTLRGIQKEILSKLDVDTFEEASNGRDALDKVDAFQPELLLVDWDMPNMDGLSFIKAYRARGGTAPVIMVANESEKQQVIEALRTGANNYLIKPLTPDTVAQRIRETLAHSAAA